MIIKINWFDEIIIRSKVNKYANCCLYNFEVVYMVVSCLRRNHSVMPIHL